MTRHIARDTWTIHERCSKLNIKVKTACKIAKGTRARGRDSARSAQTWMMRNTFRFCEEQTESEKRERACPPAGLSYLPQTHHTRYLYFPAVIASRWLVVSVEVRVERLALIPAARRTRATPYCVATLAERRLDQLSDCLGCQRRLLRLGAASSGGIGCNAASALADG